MLAWVFLPKTARLVCLSPNFLASSWNVLDSACVVVEFVALSSPNLCLVVLSFAAGETLPVLMLNLSASSASLSAFYTLPEHLDIYVRDVPTCLLCHLPSLTDLQEFLPTPSRSPLEVCVPIF